MQDLQAVSEEIVLPGLVALCAVLVSLHVFVTCIAPVVATKAAGQGMSTKPTHECDPDQSGEHNAYDERNHRGRLLAPARLGSAAG